MRASWPKQAGEGCPVLRVTCEHLDARLPSEHAGANECRCTRSKLVSAHDLRQREVALARPVRAVRLAPMRSLDLARSSAKLTSKPVLVAYSSSAQVPSRISPAPAALRPHGLMAGTVLDHSRRGGADRSKRTRR